jgi:hypothetical protein
MNVSKAASTRPGRTIQTRKSANRGKKAAIRADRMNILNLLGDNRTGSVHVPHQHK